MNLRAAIVLLIVLAGGWLVFRAIAPTFTDRGSRNNNTVKVLNNLKQLEMAKDMWARDHGATGSVEVSAQDILPYLPAKTASNRLVLPVMGERYLINPTGVAPEAQLTGFTARWPSGAVIRLYDRPTVLLPNPQGAANGWQPLSSEANRPSSSATPRRAP